MNWERWAPAHASAALAVPGLELGTRCDDPPYPRLSERSFHGQACGLERMASAPSAAGPRVRAHARGRGTE